MSLTTAMTAQMGQQQFLNLLVTQLQNQDPLNPISNTDFITQLSQFSVQQGMEQLNTSFSDMLTLQKLTQGSNLIGKSVVYQPSGSSAGPQQGTVSGVTVNQGQLHVQIGGQSLPLSSIQGFTAPSA